MKIAVVGSGVSGLVSAYLASKHHEVTIYEKANRLGGHAHTITVNEDGKEIKVDNGFMVFNPDRYPNFVALLGELGVASQETQMSFGVTIPGEITYSGRFPNGLFADRSNIFNIRYIKFLLEILKFSRAAKRTLAKGNDDQSNLDQFLTQNNLSQDLANWYLFPMLSAIWSIKETSKVGDFPALSTFAFLNNHKLLDLTQPVWRTIINGSSEYVSKIENQLRNNGTTIVLNSNISSIKRSEDTVEIIANDITSTYDYVIMATHADTTIGLLSDLGEDERKALGKFKFSDNKVVLHNDTRLVPQNRRVLSAWNYTKVDVPGDPEQRSVFTYCMNILQHIDMSTPMLVTLNPHFEIDQDKTYSVEEYSHPQYNLDSIEGQKEIKLLQSKRRTLYVGAYLGYGFHEDGVESAIKAVKYLGIEPSWQKSV